jgi:hypothetical protein
MGNRCRSLEATCYFYIEQKEIKGQCIKVLPLLICVSFQFNKSFVCTKIFTGKGKQINPCARLVMSNSSKIITLK